MLKASLVAGVSLLFCAPFGFAQSRNDTSEQVDASDPALILPDVDVAGLRPVAVGDLSSSVTVLDADLLAVRNAPYLADQLRTVPGLAISRSGSAGALTQVRIRGAEANHTLVLIDGVEVSDPISGDTDFGLMSGLTAKSVEVLRGEQSALYGSDAIGGVINVVTTESAGATGFLEGGSRNTYRLDLGYGGTFDAGRFNVAFTDVISDGVDTSGLGGEEDGYQNYGVIGSGAVSLSPDWDLTGLIRYGYAEVDTDPDLDFDGRLDDADRVTESDQWTFGAALQGDGAGLNHLLRASFNRVDRENFADGASTNTNEGERTKLSYSPSVGLFTQQGAADFVLSGLIDWEQEDYSARDTEFGGFTNQDQSFETLSLGGEFRVVFADLQLTASARHDYNDGRFEDATTWRLGAAFEPYRGTRLRASAGTGVKNPTFTELFGFFPGSFVGNPDLNPEESTSWEIGWDQNFGAVTTALTYFRAELEDEIADDFSVFPFTVVNRAGTNERSGIEASADWTINDAWSVFASASNISSENDQGVDEIRVPETTGSVSLNWTPEREGLRAGLGLDYVGEQKDTDFGTFETVELDAYWLVSASMDYPVTDRFSVTLRGENLLDEDVVDVFGFRGPGAGVFIGLRLR
ncbi:MAG: TonB-dependent receptor [Pseudomonadota bacterium]